MHGQGPRRRRVVSSVSHVYSNVIGEGSPGLSVAPSTGFRAVTQIFPEHALQDSRCHAENHKAPEIVSNREPGATDHDRVAGTSTSRERTMARRSNVIVILGLAVFIVGAAATYFLVRDSGGSDSESSVAGGVPVLYASDNIPAGTSGSDALQARLVKTKHVTPAAK